MPAHTLSLSNSSRYKRLGWSLLTSAFIASLAACGGGGSSDSASTGTTTTTTTPVVSTTPTPTVTTPLPATPLAQRAGQLATALGKPKRLLLGLGGTYNTVSVINGQSLKPDVIERYLVGLPSTGGWTTWNSPAGEYVTVVGADADSIGAVPMFTLYQMAAWGDGNLWGLSNTSYMTEYWNSVRLMFNKIKTYNKPVLVNLEPDFWGYAQRIAADPNNHFAYVAAVNSDCSNLPDTVAGMGRCLIQMARWLAPKAYIGFPPSTWGDLVPTEMAYFQKLGAAQADFVVMQTLDRDAGCMEAQYTGNGAGCNRSSSVPFYWDMTNATSPNFTEHLSYVKSVYESLQLPIVWWQTPMGVPSSTAGGSVNAFRDNRMQYFLTHPAELVAAGGALVVFGPGHTSQTFLGSDGGQYKRLSTQYLASPTALP